jgi:hypothetical protein
VTSGLDERRFERSRCHMRKRYAFSSLFSGQSPMMLAPKRLPSHICSSRLDWNFDNMELSVLACEAVNCCVQGLRRETIDRVRKKIFLAHNYDAQGPRNISLSNKDSPISRFHALPLSASKSPWPQQRYTANRRDSLRSGCVGRGGLRFPSAHPGSDCRNATCHLARSNLDLWVFTR